MVAWRACPGRDGFEFGDSVATASEIRPSKGPAVKRPNSGGAAVTQIGQPLIQAMWKSELALLIYLAVLVWTAVAARPLVAHYLVAPQPGITWRLVP